MSSEWELPLNDEIKQLGRFSRVKVKDNRMEITNGKAEPIAFMYNGNDQMSIFQTIHYGCREELIKTGEYSDDVVEKICILLVQAIVDYVKTRETQSHEQESISEDIISLDIEEDLQREQILDTFEMSIKTRCITAHMNKVYANKTVISNVYDDWTQTIDTFTTNAKRKGISDKHIGMLTDAIDSNSQSIISHLRGDQNQPNSLSNDRIGIALELVQERVVNLFLDEVKAPYATIRVDGHVETIPIQSQRFGDWVGALFYNHNREQRRSLVLSEQGIGQIQRVLRFEAENNDMRTLHIRVAAFVDTNTDNRDQNVIFYDLCNKNWETIKITHHGWSIEPNSDQVSFKRFRIMTEQIHPERNYPLDIMDQFIKLTNVHEDDDSKLVAEVYIISLFLLANLPKPIMVPHGIHGSGKSTLQEFIKQLVDPAAALTTAFPDTIPDLVQSLSHSYLTFFDNVSKVSDLTSDQLCRAVTGSGFTKRGLYTNDEDFIYNMKRAVGFNGINVAATKPDLLDRILNIQLKPIDRRQRKKLQGLQKDFERIRPCLLGYIFDIIVKVLKRLGEVRLEDGLPRMADFAEMGELIARCLGYKDGEFTAVYNENIGLTNEEAINASLVATAITSFMETRKVFSGTCKQVLSELNQLTQSTPSISWISKNKDWPKSATGFSNKLNEIMPNLLQIGIVVQRDYNSHTKSDKITIVNNDYKPPTENEECKPLADKSGQGRIANE